MRVQLWTPYNGPAAFEFHRDSTLERFDQLLATAGHTRDRALAVAYDTLGTTLDLVSTPSGPTVWWIVRDGLNRELLRPVALWTEPGARYVMTINSHGQAQALSCAPEVSRLSQLPQGVRATITLPISRAVGQMSTSGLVLYEVAIGSFARAKGHRGSWALLFLGALATLHPSLAMQVPPGLPSQQDLAVQTRQHRPQVEPVVARIWTYSCDAPVEVPFDPTPDLTRMHRQVEGTGRGIPPTGDFVWTSPSIVQGRAHILHFPPRTVPPYVYWLLHYRARGHVVAASDLAFDWALVGALAADAFGETWFGQGTFGVVQQGRVVQYGESIGIPPHGALIHLVRTSLQPRLGYTGWDAPADPGCIMPFDYDICLGAKGSMPIVLDTHGIPRVPRNMARPSSEAAPAAESEAAQVSRQLERQIADVSNDLQVLVTRLETAGVLPTPEVAPWATESPPADSTADPARSAASRLPRHPLLGLLASCLSLLHFPGVVRPLSGQLIISIVVWHGLGASAKDHDHESSSEEPQLSEPSSPSDLEAVQAPTPLTSLSEVPGESPVVLPSSEAAASTSVPDQESLAGGIVPGGDQHICTMQHRFSCAIRGVPLVVPNGEPYITAGHPVITHNPFTGRPQCRLRTTIQGNARILCNTLADYAARRGWGEVIDVQPQPDAQAIHLIPSASRPDLVSVLLAADDGLHPMCVSRSFPSRSSRPYRFGNREGRVMAPYPTRRVTSGPAQLRDGECLPVNFGPFGPPPPQPAHDAAHPSASGSMPAAVVLFSRWPGAFICWLALSNLALGMLEAGEGKPIYRVSAFPWRRPPDQRTAQEVCGSRPCRFTVLCPWTGQQGIYTTDSHSLLETTWQRYRLELPGWPNQQYMPTWPGLRHDRLTVIPVSPSPDIACVVVRHAYNSRAIVLPACISPLPTLALC